VPRGGGGARQRERRRWQSRGRAARCSGGSAAASPVGGLSLAVMVAPYVELEWGVLGGDSSPTVIEELGGRR
jgi:hypothetical protein